MSLDLPIVKEVNVTCPSCRAIFSTNISITELVHINTIETCMGVETQYDFTSELECILCHRRFKVNGEVTEYPEGNLYDFSLKED